MTRRTSAWELDQEALDRLLRALDEHPDLASRRYEALRRRLIDLFSWEQRDTPEELADETLNRLARRLGDGVVIEGDVGRYAFGIARLLLHEDARAKRRRESALREMPISVTPPDSAEMLDRLDACLEQLSDDSRRLIERYYTEERATLAQALGISLNALRNRALRIRQQLHDCVTGERDV
jgi:DNA-directed RNA polymerase specialized sigma24 family protein